MVRNLEPTIYLYYNYEPSQSSCKLLILTNDLKRKTKEIQGIKLLSATTHNFLSDFRYFIYIFSFM
ncbi:hypothetical protein Hanom_Chr14g01311591 [Helianthus anomalus]